MNLTEGEIEKKHAADHAAYRRALRVFHEINSLASPMVNGSMDKLFIAEKNIQTVWRSLSWSGNALSSSKAHEHTKPTVRGR